MMLLEHDSKALLARRGLHVPAGFLATNAAQAARAALPVVVKAQVPVGGRGKAGGIRLAHSAADRDGAVADILGMTIKGHVVHAVRMEQPVDFVAETYISFSVDAAAATIRVMISPLGGIDIESEAARPHLLCAEAAFDVESLSTTVARLAGTLSPLVQSPVEQAGALLAQAFFDLEAMLLEINPLFICADGSWVLGDAKFVADDNAFERRTDVRDCIVQQPLLYPQAVLKLEQGYDFACLDPGGDIGLVTTGAGLSMQLVDELVARGHRPFNFCDIRTGEFRGKPDRLIQVLRMIAAGPGIRAVLVNFFAGLTDLGETTQLLLEALVAVPEIRVPVTARLIGNNLDEALRVVARAGNPIVVETDLERAIERTIDSMQSAHAG